MAVTGYSGTPLIKKLGIKPEMKVLVLHEPEDYFQWLGSDISKQYIVKNESPGFVHLFAKDKAVFIKEMKAVLQFTKKKHFGNCLGILV